MTASLKEKTAQGIFNAWSAYDTVLANNYLFHQEIYRDVKRLLCQRYADAPFTILDLGCGNAHHLAAALDGCRVAAYHGHDLSEAALAQARGNMARLGCPVTLHQGDLLEGVRNAQEKYDLIFSSFALHHLAHDEKAAFFEYAYRALDENGLLLLIDVARGEDEDRATYLERYCGWIEREWKALSPEEMKIVLDHIRSGDFPETASELRALSVRAGFAACRHVNRFGWHHTWCFEKQLS